MKVNYQIQNTTQFSVLSDDQIEMIYMAALRVLESTGVRVHGDEGVALLTDADGHVSDGNLVHIPSHAVKSALQTAPERVGLYGRDGDKHRCEADVKVILEKNKVYYGTGSDCPFILDSQTKERRSFTFDDVANAAKIADSLPNIDFFMSLGLVSDVPTFTYDRHQFLAMVANTAKPLIITAVDKAGLTNIHEMCCVIRGGEEEFKKRPLIALYAEPSSPLNHTKTAVEKLLYAAEHNIPVIYTPCPIAGATAPATLAGILVQALAECLSGLVMAQQKNRGCPVIIGGVVSILDMGRLIYSYGAPELHLLSAALTDICKWLNLPNFSTGGCSDSKLIDQQAAIESALSILFATLSGANLVHDIGYLEYALVGSYDMLVLTDEIIGMVKHIARGIRVDEESLALDVIHNVGPGGNFLGEEHTLKHFREEFWFPKLINRQNYENWMENGSTSLADRVNKKVLNILQDYQPTPLADDVLKELREIIDKADVAQVSNL